MAAGLDTSVEHAAATHSLPASEREKSKGKINT
jgi:hypothetical protein